MLGWRRAGREERRADRADTAGPDGGWREEERLQQLVVSYLSLAHHTPVARTVYTPARIKKYFNKYTTKKARGPHHVTNFKELVDT